MIYKGPTNILFANPGRSFCRSPRVHGNRISVRIIVVRSIKPIPVADAQEAIRSMWLSLGALWAKTTAQTVPGGPKVMLDILRGWWFQFRLKGPDP